MLGWRSCYAIAATSCNRRTWGCHAGGAGAEIAADLRHQHISTATTLIQRLRGIDEFDELWHEPGDASTARRCRVVCANLGVVELDREMLTAERGLRMVLYLTAPGSDSESRLALASVLGYHRFG